MSATIEREDIRLETKQGHPLLVIGGEVEILLRTFLEVDDDSDGPFGEQVDLDIEIDCDGDNGCWWQLFGEGDDPLLSIQPEYTPAHKEEFDDES